jgi:hypothetical protein
VAVSRLLKVIIAGVLLGAGAVGCVMFLSGQGLAQAALWVSIAGTVISAVVGVAGLVLARQARPARSQRVERLRVERTGDAVAHGAGSRANTGMVGRSGAGDAVVSGTGDATATGGGQANTGDDRTR